MDVQHLLTQPESEWLDFKREYLDSNLSLLHGILCLANSYADSDRYLVFGVADDRTVAGVASVACPLIARVTMSFTHAAAVLEHPAHRRGDAAYLESSASVTLETVTRAGVVATRSATSRAFSVPPRLASASR